MLTLLISPFDLAEKYRHPVLVASDAAIGQMVEPVELPAMKEHDINQYDWVIRPRRKGEKQRIVWNRYWDIGAEEYVDYLCSKYAEMEKHEQRWESVMTDDAEIVLVAYGISSVSLKQPFIKAVRKVFALVSFDPSRCGLSLKRHLKHWDPKSKRSLISK